MQTYPKGLILPLENQGLTWRFERRHRKAVCYIVDQATGKTVVEVADTSEIGALRKAIALASNVPKPLSDREMAQRIRELEARLESANVQAPEPEPPKRGRPRKEDTVAFVPPEDNETTPA